MGNDKKPTYDELRHQLESKLLGSTHQTDREQQDFITDTFVTIHQGWYEQKLINHQQYVKLINRLAGYKQGKFNDYIDTLAGAAQLGMLGAVVEGSKRHNIAAQSRQRRDAVTDLTGIEPIQPSEE